jgi:hypothetical protein
MPIDLSPEFGDLRQNDYSIQMQFQNLKTQSPKKPTCRIYADEKLKVYTLVPSILINEKAFIAAILLCILSHVGSVAFF